MKQRLLEESIIYRKVLLVERANLQMLEYFLFLSKMHYFGFSWCFSVFDYGNPK